MAKKPIDVLFSYFLYTNILIIFSQQVVTLSFNLVCYLFSIKSVKFVCM